MATIQISNLRPNGSELFSDAENYLQELSEDDMEINAVQGGALPLLVVVATYAFFATAGAKVGYDVTRAMQGR